MASTVGYRTLRCRGVGCGAVFYICRSCYRGQAYCGDECRAPAQRRQRRTANAKHQRSPEGRLDHRDHQRAYRARCRLRGVTDTPSTGRPSISHYRTARRASGHSARLHRVWARVGRAAHAETALAGHTEDDQAAGPVSRSPRDRGTGRDKTMRGKRRVLATLVIGELMFAFGEGGSSSEAIRDQDSTRVFRPVRAVSLTLPGGDKSDQSDPRGVEVEPCATSRAVTQKGTFRGGRSGHGGSQMWVTRILGTPLKPGLHPDFCWNSKGSNAGSRDPKGCCSDVAHILGHALGSRPNLGRGSGP